MISSLLHLEYEREINSLCYLIIHTRSLGVEPGVLRRVDTNATILPHYLMSFDNLCVIILKASTYLSINIQSR